MTGRRAIRFGFTLLEVLLVLAILSVLAAIVMPNLIGRQRKAKIQTTRITIAGVEGALRMYAAEHEGEYPEGRAEEVFGLLMNAGDNPAGQRVSSYLDEMPLDGWERPLHYEYPTTRHARASKPAVWSAGPNEKNDDGGEDDINNWDTDAQ